MTIEKRIIVCLGGSWRKYKRQEDHFKAANIEILFLIGCKGKYTAKFLMPDTPAARELLESVGGTICRDQGEQK
jgi:hypothetical protein